MVSGGGGGHTTGLEPPRCVSFKFKFLSEFDVTAEMALGPESGNHWWFYDEKAGNEKSHDTVHLSSFFLFSQVFPAFAFLLLYFECTPSKASSSFLYRRDVLLICFFFRIIQAVSLILLSGCFQLFTWQFTSKGPCHQFRTTLK